MFHLIDAQGVIQGARWAIYFTDNKTDIYSYYIVCYYDELY